MNTQASPLPPAPGRRSRPGLWLLGFVLLLALALWASVTLSMQLWDSSPLGMTAWPHEARDWASAWGQDLDIVIDGQPWSLGEGLKTVLGWSVAALVLGGLLLLALALLPLTLGAVALLVLLPVGLVLALVALPVLLLLGLLALLLSPLLLLGGLAWMLFA